MRLIQPSHVLAALIAVTGCGSGQAAPRPVPVAAMPAPLPAPRDSPLDAFLLADEANAAYERADWAACAELFARIAAATPFPSKRAEALWTVASCQALGGTPEPAVASMRDAAAAGLLAIDEVRSDPDLASLTGQAGWDEVLAMIADNAVTYAASTDPELKRIYAEDQAERAGGWDSIDWTVTRERDRQRRLDVDLLLAAGAAETAEDYYLAAMVYQHGEEVAEIERARELALRAIELDSGHARARWLAAAAEDRVLMYQGKPQRWGTQLTRRDGVWVVHEVAGDITDDQRAAENVPPLAANQANAEAMNAKPTQ